MNRELAEEHFFSMYIRNKLGTIAPSSPKKSKGAIFLGACFPGEHHVYGLLLFVLATRERGLSYAPFWSRFAFRRIPIPLFVGGMSSTVLQNAFKSLGAIPVGEDIITSLDRIQITLQLEPCFNPS